MIIPIAHQYARQEDYDGYNDYYINPEFQQPFRRHLQAQIEIGEEEEEQKTYKKVAKNKKNTKKSAFFCKKIW